MSEAGEEAGSTAPAGATSTEKLSLGILFQQCITYATEVTDCVPSALAMEIKAIVKRIDESYFRLQIWGSDMSKNSSKSITFDDILAFGGSVLPGSIKEVLEAFEQNFRVVGRVLSSFTADSSPAVMIPPEKLYDPLKELRAATEAIAGLVRDLVDLSDSIQIEQGLRNSDGPYNELYKQIERTEGQFQHRTCSSSATKRLQGSTAIEGEESTFTEINSEKFDPWTKTYLLSFDGGGVRSFSSLLILAEIIREIEKQELANDSEAISSYSPCLSSIRLNSGSGREQSRYLPCHYFDYIAGTSTGGLIAIMLGRLRMTVSDCINEFIRLSMKVFGRNRWLHIRNPLPWTRSKYNHKDLEIVIKDLIARRVWRMPGVLNAEGDVLYASPPQMCRTITIAWKESQGLGVPYLFRTYDHRTNLAQISERSPLEKDLGPANKISIWQVARATSAAPTYFDPIEIAGNVFIDGGFGANNPTMEAFREIRQLSVGQWERHEFVLSIGAGKPDIKSSLRAIYALGIFRFPTRLTSDSERTHLAMDIAAHGSSYQRLNVESGLGAIKLDEWKKSRTSDLTIEKITAITTEYLRQPDVQARIKTTARILVENRQVRSKSSRWKSFCLGETSAK